MSRKPLPLDRIFDKTGNKYLSTCIIIKRARQLSEKNSLIANDMNIKADNKNVIETTVREFLSDELMTEQGKGKLI
ncbi:MAG: DNA-directed RNA polymerase subunit omega [Candidatus Muirbacterium halophilum]|nr:DNA-directed RNA polymerase subunit omega [Candidatus Muirbacterium halophilum]